MNTLVTRNDIEEFAEEFCSQSVGVTIPENLSIHLEMTEEEFKTFQSTLFMPEELKTDFYLSFIDGNTVMFNSQVGIVFKITKKR